MYVCQAGVTLRWGQGGWGFFRASEERVICETATRSRFRGGASVADEV